MGSIALSDVDLIEELQLRRWAREHYVPENQRQNAWHPVVHDEMTKRDREAPDPETATAHYAWTKT